MDPTEKEKIKMGVKLAILGIIVGVVIAGFFYFGVTTEVIDPPKVTAFP